MIHGDSRQPGPGFRIGSEAFPALSSESTELYFYSARPGGSGSFDLYWSVRTPVPEPGALVLTSTGLLRCRQHGPEKVAN